MSESIYVACLADLSQLECGHFVHAVCGREQLQKGRPTARLTFGFMSCPVCRADKVMLARFRFLWSKNCCSWRVSRCSLIPLGTDLPFVFFVVNDNVLVDCSSKIETLRRGIQSPCNRGCGKAVVPFYFSFTPACVMSLVYCYCNLLNNGEQTTVGLNVLRQLQIMPMCARGDGSESHLDQFSSLRHGNRRVYV